jgi:hypothetical protein
MDKLTEFLRICIAEERAEAEAATPGPWEMDELWDGEPWEVTIFPERGGSTTVARTWRNDQGKADATHIARWNPKRVIDQLDANLRIVELAQSAAEERGGNVWPPRVHMTGMADGLLLALQALALPYADRPGYREEWRP